MKPPIKAVIVGSFDPVTNGHLWVIQQAVRMFDSVDIVIAGNAAKPGGMFTFKEREDLLRMSMSNDRLSVFGSNWDIHTLGNTETSAGYAQRTGASVIVRGIRNTTDFEFERQLNLVNSKIAPGVETIYLMPPRELIEVSSSFVKSLVGLHGWQLVVKSYVPNAVFEKLRVKNVSQV